MGCSGLLAEAEADWGSQVEANGEERTEKLKDLSMKSIAIPLLLVGLCSDLNVVNQTSMPNSKGESCRNVISKFWQLSWFNGGAPMLTIL